MTAGNWLAATGPFRNSDPVTPRVTTEDLVDTQGVAEILGLAHRNTVHQYQQRYSDMPKPVFDLGKGRVKLWLRPEIERWAEQQAAHGRTRPRDPPHR